jgi:hypothetical protein
MDQNDVKSQKLDGAALPHHSEDDQCAAARAGLPRRETFKFNLQEEVCLDVVRELLSMYMTADAQHWHSALEFVEMHLGDTSSAQFVAQATNFVRALRIERSCPFNFLTFGCKHITSDELAMMSALQAARLGPKYEFNDALQYLAQSGSYAQLERTIAQLAELLRDPSLQNEDVSEGKSCARPAFSTLH